MNSIVTFPAGTAKVGDRLFHVRGKLKYNARGFATGIHFCRRSPYKTQGLKIQVGRVLEVGVTDPHGNSKRPFGMDIRYRYVGSKLDRYCWPFLHDYETVRSPEIDRVILFPPASELPEPAKAWARQHDLLIAREPIHAVESYYEFRCGECLGKIDYASTCDEIGDLRYRRETFHVGNQEVVDGGSSCVCARCGREFAAPDDVETSY